jgi:hypothetical protein
LTRIVEGKWKQGEMEGWGNAPLKREIEDSGCFGPRKPADDLSFCRLNAKIRTRIAPPVVRGYVQP